MSGRIGLVVESVRGVVSGWVGLVVESVGDCEWLG